MGFVVPIAPGIPPIIRSGLPPIIELLTGDTVLGFGSNLQPVWGIYQDGVPVVLADTASAFTFKREWAVADYQIERGGFESYDKVDLPFEPRVQMVAGGSIENRKAFLESITRIAGDLQLYDVVTPEEIYTSVNIQHYDFRRTSRNGVGLLSVDIWLLEIRVIGSSGQDVKDASGATQSNDGSVQPTSPTNSQQSVLPQVK